MLRFAGCESRPKHFAGPLTCVQIGSRRRPQSGRMKSAASTFSRERARPGDGRHLRSICSPDGTLGSPVAPGFWLSVRVLSRLFRRLFLAQVRCGVHHRRAHFDGVLQEDANRSNQRRTVEPVDRFTKPPALHFAEPGRAVGATRYCSRCAKLRSPPGCQSRMPLGVRHARQPVLVQAGDAGGLRRSSCARRGTGRWPARRLLWLRIDRAANAEGLTLSVVAVWGAGHWNASPLTSPVRRTRFRRPDEGAPYTLL
jgi:hypothetical protein